MALQFDEIYVARLTAGGEVFTKYSVLSSNLPNVAVIEAQSGCYSPHSFLADIPVGQIRQLEAKAQIC